LAEAKGVSDAKCREAPTVTDESKQIESNRVESYLFLGAGIVGYLIECQSLGKDFAAQAGGNGLLSKRRKSSTR
jgi:hypothetical protein